VPIEEEEEEIYERNFFHRTSNYKNKKKTENNLAKIT
jgi:hypothetical protein